MSNEQFQDKYEEVLQEMKKEKMNWDFDDFIQKTEQEVSEKQTPVFPIGGTKKPRFPKIFWMAASIALIAGLVFGIQKLNSNEVVEAQNAIVQAKIKAQKDTILNESNMAYQDVQDSLQIRNQSVMRDSLANEVSNPDKVMNQITPQKGRIQKAKKERIAYESPSSKPSAPEYESNYVIVNGHKIRNEEEAINVTKYSFQVLSDNVKKTIASSVVQERPNDN